MKNMKSIGILFLTTIVASLVGCSKSQSDDYEKVSATQAKEMMDENSEVTILDVRTQEEFNEGHIEGATLIPLDQISSTAESTLTDKSATILVYCRSGRRSAEAAKELSKLGYTNIYDFGGIMSWPYDVVTE